MARESFRSRFRLALVVTATASPLLDAQTVLWSYKSQVGDLDRMGDLDADGVPDVVITDKVSGSMVPIALSGVDGSVIYTFGAGGHDGSAVAGVGDFDGDGTPDLLFGDRLHTNPSGYDVGSVVCLSGATGGLLFNQFGRPAPYGPDVGLGGCVRGMGDVDGDGYADFAFSEWLHVAVFGAGPSHVFEVGHAFAGEVDLSSNLGDHYVDVHPANVIAALEDLDGDGRLDFAASCVSKSTNIGFVSVFSSKTMTVLKTITGTGASDGFGSTLGSCGDVDGDGLRELLVGAPGRNTGGAVQVYGSATWTMLYELDGTTAAQRFGIDVDGLDDVDGDGVDDFVVASDGSGARLQVFSAASGRELFRFDKQTAKRVRDVGDLDGDGHDDLAANDGVSATAFAFRPFVGLDAIAPDRIRWDLVGTLALSGAGFTADPNLSVLVDGVSATNVVVTDYGALTCTPPALLPGPHDVTVTDRFGSATLAGGLLLTPAQFVDGGSAIGSTITLRYEFEALDSTFAVAGAPPLQSIPTPPFGGALAISPFIPLFILNAWPTDEYLLPQTIPNDPALVGVSVLLQALTGPKLSGPGRQGAWTNVVEITFQ